MDQNTLIAILALVVLVIIIGVWLMVRRRHTDHLRDRFGDEYDRTVKESGDRTAAERALLEREKRVEALEIRQLTADENQRFATEWREVKAVFVDSPTEAVLHADRMLATMMKTVGYPMADFDRRFEDLTVNHGDVARHYREGNAIVQRHGQGAATTEDMRQAMKHYEAVFDHLSTGNEAAPTVAETHDPNPPATTRRTDLDGDGQSDLRAPSAAVRD
ncbi:MAG: hypothetical protein JY451_05090 [Erythrobacter sp.]|nr:MAG: hypothetical protein JY451_05090 [Erythrobacter sp.]